MSRFINKGMQRKAWLLSLALAFVSAPALAGQVWIPGIAGAQFQVSVKSIQARRFERTIHQRYDYSCGAAAVATLLTYQYHDPVGEMDIFKYMWKHGNQAKIQHQGFSLLDMKNYLDAHGFQANGYNAPLSKLKQTGIPAIMLVSEHGYNHFVVVKGEDDKRVLLGDPSFGTRVMPVRQFKKILVSPIVFVVTNHRAQAVFNGSKDWSTQPLAPLGTALGPGKLALLNNLLRPSMGSGAF